MKRVFLLLVSLLFSAGFVNADSTIMGNYRFPVSLVKTQIRQISPNHFIGPIAIMRMGDKLQIIIDDNRCTSEGVCDSNPPLTLDGFVVAANESENAWQVQVASVAEGLLEKDPRVIKILWLVISKNNARAEIRTMGGNYPASSYTWVGKLDGSINCQQGTGEDVEEVKDQLEAKGVRILLSSKGRLGFPSISCGDKSNSMNVFLVHQDDEKITSEMSFVNLRLIPDATIMY